MPERLVDFYGRVDGFFSVYGGNVEGFSSSIEKFGTDKIDVASGKNGGHTLAHFACYGSSKIDILRKLKDIGANLFQLDDFSRPPIFVAANSGKKEFIEYLIEEYKQASKDLFIVDTYGRSLIHAICSYGSSPDEKAKDQELAASLELLLQEYKTNAERKAALQQPDKSGLTPVQLANACGLLTTRVPVTNELKNTQFGEVFSKYGINPQEVVIMPETGISFEQYDFFNRTWLMYITFINKLVEVQEELNKPHVVVNQHNAHFGGRNALHLSCGGIASPEVVKAILSKIISEDIISCDNFGSNALMFAANTGRLDIVKALMEGVILENGEERKFPVDQINAQDVKGFTALHAAAMASSRPDSRRQVITLLFDHNIDPTLVDATGKTALELAESRGNRVVADAIKDEIEKRKSAEHGLLLATSLEPQTYTPGFTSNSSASQVSVTRETKDVSVEASVTESPTSKPLFPSP